MELGVSRIQKPEHQAAGWAWLKQFTQANCCFLPLDEKKALVTIVLHRVSYGVLRRVSYGVVDRLDVWV
jgi:hypothetical protein